MPCEASYKHKQACERMKEKGIKKTPGCNWIEVNREVHAFLAGDRSHPQMQKIYMELERFSQEMKLAGSPQI